MNNINVIIVDDERPARKELFFLLRDKTEITVVGEADNIQDAILLIKDKKPDLVFLDIQLAGENGFDLLQKVEINFKVIFVTAYDEFAVRAFQLNSIDYLLKPIKQNDLMRAMNKLDSMKSQFSNSGGEGINISKDSDVTGLVNHPTTC